MSPSFKNIAAAGRRLLMVVLIIFDYTHKNVLLLYLLCNNLNIQGSGFTKIQQQKEIGEEGQLQVNNKYLLLFSD